MPTRPAIPFASWTAPAKRSGDGAFARTREPRARADHRPHESGVALPAAVHDAPRNDDAPPLFPIAGWILIATGCDPAKEKLDRF
jgi:hypothetical protein